MCVYVVVSRTPETLHDHANLDAAALDPVVLVLLRLLVAHLLLWSVLLLLLLLLLSRVSAVLHLLLLARVAARHRVCGSVMRLSVLCVLRLVLLAVIEGRHLRWAVAAVLFQVDVDAALVMFGVVLQSKFAADRLDTRLELLHMASTVVSFADNHVQVRLAVLSGVADALLENLLCFFDELAVEIDGVGVDLAHGVVFTENELGGLSVVVVGFGGVRLALVRQVFGSCAVAALVGLLRARGERLVLTLLFTSEVAQAVILVLGVYGCAVVEGWR